MSASTPSKRTTKAPTPASISTEGIDQRILERRLQVRYGRGGKVEKRLKDGGFIYIVTPPRFLETPDFVALCKEARALTAEAEDESAEERATGAESRNDSNARSSSGRVTGNPNNPDRPPRRESLMPLPPRPIQRERAPVDRLPVDRLNDGPQDEESARRGSLSQRQPIRGDDGREARLANDSARDARPNGSRSEARHPDGKPLTAGSRRPTLPIRESSTMQPSGRDARTIPESPFGNDDEDGFIGKRKTYDKPADYTAGTSAGEAARIRQPSNAEADIKGKGRAQSVRESTYTRPATRPAVPDPKDRVSGDKQDTFDNGRDLKNERSRDSTVSDGRNEARSTRREVDDRRPAHDPPSRDFRDQQDRATTRDDIHRKRTKDNGNPYNVPARTDSRDARQQDDNTSRPLVSPRERLAPAVRDDADRCDPSCKCGNCHNMPSRRPAPNTPDSRSYVPSQVPRGEKSYHSERNMAIKAPRTGDSRSYVASQAPRGEKKYHDDRNERIQTARIEDESRRERGARDVVPIRRAAGREPSPDTHGHRRPPEARDRLAASYAWPPRPHELDDDTYGR